MPNHRITETELFKLLKKQEVRDGFEAAEVSSRVSAVAGEVWPLLQQVSRSFPLYTLHDPEHSFRVAENMAQMIPKRTLAQLNSLELSILLYAAYLHDSGMASSQEELYAWLKSNDYDAFIAAHDNWASAIRLHERQREKPDDDDPDAKPVDDLVLRQIQDVAYTDYLREKHPERGAQLVLDQFGSAGKSDNKIQIQGVNYAEYVALVCKSHGDSATLLKGDEFRRDAHVGIIASGRYKNIVVVVPTIALIDETRRRLSRFSPAFKVVTQVSQSPGDSNIFVFTAERANVYEEFPHIDFFVIDEFYKIGAVAADQKRTVALNHAFYKLSKGGGQFYLLGPCVRQIPEGLEARFRCRFFPTTYATVASDLIRVKRSGSDLNTLCQLVKKLQGEPTLIFCKSPKSTNEVAKALLDTGVTEQTHDADSAAGWMEQHFHPEWVLPRSMKQSIGIHHGRLPRSLGQYVVRAFNDGRIDVLICTSTLIEGVNTKAKNVIIFDNTIAREKLDFFTFNNIKGRSGRMFEHFVGRVFLFHEPPEEELPFVDFPVFTQGADMPDSILVQLDDGDLSPESRTRLEPFTQQTDLPMELLKIHSSIEPDNLLALARHLKTVTAGQRALLAWTGFPRYESLKLVCELAWKHLIGGGRRAGVGSGSQLALKISKLNQTPDIRRRILD
jgi:hypothetical protein